jgi:hypothetical protein
MQTTSNSSAFIDAQVYSNFILELIHDGLLPTTFYRDVSDFGSGTTLNIKTVGTVTLQDLVEDQAIAYNPIDTGTVNLTITDFIGNGWYVTDVLRQDGSQIDVLMAQHATENTRAIQENFETKFLEVCNTAQTDAAANNINGFAHRIASAETNNIVTLDHLKEMKLAFDKAGVPAAGRVLLVDPVVEATLNGLLAQTATVNNDPMFQGLVQDGFARDHQFVRNIMGWNIMTSNRLDKGSFGDGTTTVSDGVANVFMNVLDDQHKPVMAAWRQQPMVEGERNKDKKRDEFVSSARFGIGAQRLDTLGILITSASAFE